MKLLLVFLGAIIAVNGDNTAPIQFSDLTTEDFRKIWQSHRDVIYDTIRLMKNMTNTMQALLLPKLKKNTHFIKFQKKYVQRMMLKAVNVSSADIRDQIVKYLNNDEIYFNIIQKMKPYDSLDQTDLTTLNKDVLKYLRAIKEGTDISEETKNSVLKKLKQMPEIVQLQQQLVEDAIKESIRNSSENMEKKILKYFHEKGNHIYLKVFQKKLEKFYEVFQFASLEVDINYCKQNPTDCSIIGDPQIELVYELQNLLHETEFDDQLKS